MEMEIEQQHRRSSLEADEENDQQQEADDRGEEREEEEENAEQISVKILVLGPPRSGKTSIANYLADSQDAVSKDYRPTQGVRIVEFESNQLELEGDRVNAEVELWDCSGDRKFESCWPAIRHHCNGVIFVCNPELSVGDDLLIWYNEFALKTGVGQRNLLTLLHHTNDRTNDSAIAAFRLPPEMSGISVWCAQFSLSFGSKLIPSNIDREGEELRLAFNNFLCDIIADVHAKR